MGLEGVKTGAFFLRFFEMIFSIVVFSTIVDYDGSSRIKYTMFVGITGFVIALFMMVLYVGGVRAARGAVSFVLDLLWTILWLAAAGCVTSFLTDMPVETSKVRASTAFAWLSWFLWIGSTLISFQDWRGGVAGPPPAGAPTIPNSSVSMV